MVTDRVIIVSNGNTSVELTGLPFSVQKTKGFDRLEVQNVTSQGYDQDGATLINSYVLPRSMEITGQVQASTTIQMQELREQLQDIFLPKRDITISHRYGGRTRVIKARVEKSPQFDFTEATIILDYAVVLTAVEPYWRDAAETLVQIANITGGLHFPLIIPKDKGVTFGVKSKSLITNVYNKSAFRVPMRYVFLANGVVVNPQLFNIKTRKFMKLLCTMEAGEKITVESGDDYLVTRNRGGAKENYIGKIDLAGGGSTFLTLDPGDNLFRYGAESGEDMLEMRIFFCNKYPGV